ncbi:hypothetical protein [Actinomadura decatromicini]|uniref:DUF3040 domain-containing protein n=1 Tax=Actinomadura decatromicini TaxID=2604572 RepID=A0A5D3FC03_9ACTN|nr:hypothetical protein [Actinomadura decatromicini]TYK45424.1 hypothetical protein FXF68_32765 [Actinomadura decatromicini]
MTIPRLPREDLAAAMAARRELGPDYDDAFIETVVDRIEEVFDSRAAPRARPRRAPEPRRGERDHALLMAVLSLLAAIPLSAIAVVNGGLAGLFVTLTAIVVIYVCYTFRPR